ncbi:MAG: phosphoribosyl-AMP cyclohydrolase [Verrucomicrobiota bacterium]
MGDDCLFHPREDKEKVELGSQLCPKFDDQGLIPAIVTDADSGEVIMFAWMNEESLSRSIEIGEAVFWSRSRKELWHKGATSGNVQTIIEMRIDCDQDALWLKVKVGGHGASCHNGYHGCFYREIPTGENRFDDLKTHGEPVFNPKDVYKK